MKDSGEQFDDRVIEVCWDSDRGTWKMLRTRDDKPHANHKSIMQKIMVSIEDGVEIESVRLVKLGRVKLIRAVAFQKRCHPSGVEEPRSSTSEQSTTCPTATAEEGDTASHTGCEGAGWRIKCSTSYSWRTRWRCTRSDSWLEKISHVQVRIYRL